MLYNMKREELLAEAKEKIIEALEDEGRKTLINIFRESMQG